MYTKLANKTAGRRKRVQKELLKIRLKMGYSIRVFAKLLGYAASTYEHYENGRRTLTPEVLEAARSALKRDQRFFNVDLPARMDAVPMFAGERG
jgi:transcriptional regulator with XRE-family HTH domain